MNAKNVIEILKMVKEAEKGMSAGRFWGLVAVAGTLGVLWLLPPLIQVLK